MCSVVGVLKTLGGMLLPESVPTVSAETLAQWRGKSYSEICFEVLRLFIAEEEVRNDRAIASSPLMRPD